MTQPADSHVHTEWSWDTGAAPGSMARACARAVELGLPAVAFTEHVDLLPWRIDPHDVDGLDHLRPYVTSDDLLSPPPPDIEGYLECVDRCRSAFPGLTVLTGAELGQPHRTGAAAARLPGFDALDRVLGSLHVLRVGDDDLEPPGLYRIWPAEEVIREYLAEVPRMLAGSDAFSVVAHIDYAVGYWPTDQVGPFDPAAFEDEFRQTLRVIAGSGRALEMNVKGEVRPWIARWWREEGGRAVSVGSDAHAPDRVGRRFAETADLLAAYGFRPGQRTADFWTC